jgi:hypothetical protein
MDDVPATLPSPTASDLRSCIQGNLSRGMQHQLKHSWASGHDLKQESEDAHDLEAALRQEQAQVKWYEEQQRLRQQYRFDMQPEAPAVQPVFTPADMEQVRNQFMQRHSVNPSHSNAHHHHHHHHQQQQFREANTSASCSTSSPASSSAGNSAFLSTSASSTYIPPSNFTFPAALVAASSCGSSHRSIPPPPSPPPMPSSSTTAYQKYTSQQTHQHSAFPPTATATPSGSSSFQSFVPGSTPLPLHAALSAHFHPHAPEVNSRPQHSLLMHPNAYLRGLAATNSSAAAGGEAAHPNPFAAVGPFGYDPSLLSSSVPPPTTVSRRRSKSSKSSSSSSKSKSSKSRSRRATSQKGKRTQSGKNSKRGESIKSLLAQERPRNALGHFISVKDLQQQLEELKNKLELSQSQYRQLQDRLSCTESELESLRTQVGAPGVDVNQNNKRMRAKRTVLESIKTELMNTNQTATSPMSITSKPPVSTSDGAVFSPDQHTHGRCGSSVPLFFSFSFLCNATLTWAGWGGEVE